MPEDPPIERTAIGAACVLIDDMRRVLLVHHTYGRLNWELPGGGSEAGETPEETAQRELLEETGLRADMTSLAAVYYEPGHEHGPMLHFVFRCQWMDGVEPSAASPEVSEARFWPIDNLPAPMSDFTERRVHDAELAGAVRVARVDGRRWRD